MSVGLAMGASFREQLLKPLQVKEVTPEDSVLLCEQSNSALGMLCTSNLRVTAGLNPLTPS